MREHINDRFFDGGWSSAQKKEKSTPEQLKEHRKFIKILYSWKSKRDDLQALLQEQGFNTVTRWQTLTAFYPTPGQTRTEWTISALPTGLELEGRENISHHNIYGDHMNPKVEEHSSLESAFERIAGEKFPEDSRWRDFRELQKLLFNEFPKGRLPNGEDVELTLLPKCIRVFVERNYKYIGSWEVQSPKEALDIILSRPCGKDQDYNKKNWCI